MAIPLTKYQNISFSTQFRYQRVISKGHIDFTLGTNSTFNLGTFTIPHNLGYRPFFRLFFQFPGSLNIYQMESGTQTYGLVGAYQIETIASDTSNISIQISCSGPSAGIGKVYYRIYQEPQA